MNTLSHRRILLAITGSVAAYKGLELLRLLRQVGSEVKVVLTKSAQEFITPLSVQALLGSPPYLDEFIPHAEDGMDHIALAKWAELIIIAPATANTLTCLAEGEARDLLGSLSLATRAQFLIAPAMNQAMWGHPAVVTNVALLKARGAVFCGPVAGEQACGDVGLGRMSDPTEILAACNAQFESLALAGHTVLITAGPTQETIDPVRVLTNHSSGKMGYALARAAKAAGAHVVLVSGPVALPPIEGVDMIRVTSCDDMYSAVMSEVSKATLFIAAAAVSDFRPKKVSLQKIKKTEILELECERTPDILKSVCALTPKPFCVGFAAETENLMQNAKKKLIEKKVDIIVANQIDSIHPVFGSDENEVILISENEQYPLPKASKLALAEQIIEYVSREINKRSHPNVSTRMRRIKNTES